jgi:hypothetical protein
MSFFNKNKKIILKAYTYSGELAELFPPSISSNQLPEWYESLPSVKDNLIKSVKHCVGFKELNSSSVMLPSWVEYHITVNPTGIADIHSPMPPPSGTSHPLEYQAPGAWPNYVNVKLHSPWYFWCSEPINWMWSQPVWHQKSPSTRITMPGITEFRYYHQTHVNFLYPMSSTSYTDIIYPGEPLVQVTPLTEREWELQVEVLTNEDWAKKILPWDHSFKFNYQKSRHIHENKNKGT